MYSYKMKLFTAGCVFLTCLVHALLARQKGCSFSVHDRTGEKNSPILLHNDSATLIVPFNGKVNLHVRDEIVVACPDSGNYLLGAQVNLTYAKCIHGSVLRVQDKDVDFKDLQCKKIIKGSISKTNKKCGNNQGHIYKIGYPTLFKTFVTVIEVCYDAKDALTLYTAHVIHGEAIKYASKSNYRPSFSSEGAETATSVVYKQSFQRATFSKILGSVSLSRNYINEKSYLARGHLSPDSDFLFAATQFTSYYYINVCPQWQVINGGNWKKMEMLVRKFASGVYQTLDVFTGTYAILTLPDVNGNNVGVFLVDGNKLAVPKFVWKIVYEMKSRKAVVFVSLNDPFVEGVSKGDLLCPDLCNKFGWGSESWSDFRRGFVYCCDYIQFAAVVQTAPKLQVLGVLQGPN